MVAKADVVIFFYEKKKWIGLIFSSNVCRDACTQAYTIYTHTCGGVYANTEEKSTLDIYRKAFIWF